MLVLLLITVMLCIVYVVSVRKILSRGKETEQDLERQEKAQLLSDSSTEPFLLSFYKRNRRKINAGK